jgi:hypothetical protein
MNYPEVMSELADLLADAKPDARMGAARAIAYSGNLSSVPLLRLRIQVGDTAPVLSDCFLALLQLSPYSSLDLISSSLGKGRSPEVAEAAAFALTLIQEGKIPDAKAAYK